MAGRLTIDTNFMSQLRAAGGTAAWSSLFAARGEVLSHTEETAHLFKEAQAKAAIFDGNLAVKHESERGRAISDFKVREHHTHISGDIRVHNDSILAFLEEGDSVYALTDDLKDMSVARDVPN